MTNTHINVGGHKITTNTQGSLHNSNIVSGVTISRSRWCVINGICFVEIWGYHNTDTNGNQVPIITGLPKAKLSIGSMVWGNAFYVWEADTRVIAEGHVAADCYLAVSYPVADDWVES